MRTHDSPRGKRSSGAFSAAQRRRALEEPRRFREPPRLGEVLALAPYAYDFSYLYTGQCPNERTEDGLAIVTIHGPLEHHATWWWDSYEAIVRRVESAITGMDVVRAHELAARRENWGDLPEDYKPIDAAPARAVILRIDSPGGEAAGAADAHRTIRRLKKKHGCPLFAYANETAASAAYELACACDEIWLPDTGTVGSIGVIATLYDRTGQNRKLGLNVELVTSGERKADGHADRPLTDDIRGRMQERVDDLAQVFWSVVANARGTNVKSIAALEAAVFTGQKAVDVGIADGVATWNRFLKTVRGALRAREQTELTGDSSSAA